MMKYCVESDCPGISHFTSGLSTVFNSYINIIAKSLGWKILAGGCLSSAVQLYLYYMYVFSNIT